MQNTSFMITPQLTEVLSELCDSSTLQLRIDSLEDVQDYIISEASLGTEQRALGLVREIRALSRLFRRIADQL